MSFLSSCDAPKTTIGKRRRAGFRDRGKGRFSLSQKRPEERCNDVGSTPDPAAPSTEDLALCARLRRGERSAFRDFYGRFSQPTFRFLLRLCGGSRVEAEDLHQEVWLSAARHVQRLAVDSDLAAWIFAIARNRFLSAQRQRGKDATVGSGKRDAAAAAAVPGDDDPACHDLLRALAALAQGHLEILLLLGIEALSIEQAAVVLGVRPDAVRQRLARARAALSESLAAATDQPGTPLLERRGR
jgi:RNA polymerase sigma-70 factor (ECF subfamily)